VEKKESQECPIVLLDGTSYIHVASKDIILLATTKSNLNVAMAVQFLYSVINVCKSYFGNDLDENHIRKHFVLIYELLDEIIDYGIPQLTEVQLLKQYIQEGGLKLDQLTMLERLTQLTQQATGATQWRSEGIFYKKNEVFLDVVESVNTLISHKGTILRSSVSGEIKVTCQLSGMPDCKFGLNDKLVMQRENKDDRGIAIDDIKFHQCVKLGKFDKERAITFVPPDGKFDLMTYRVTQNINLPFKITPDIQEFGGTKIEYKITLKSLFEHNYYATNVVMRIPCPRNTIKTSSHASIGRAKHEPEHGAVMWR
jgi:AP-2 complex subunit mu-1